MKSHDAARVAHNPARGEGGGRGAHAGAMGKKRCPHGRVKIKCAVCTPCPHGRVKYDCADCNGCAHGKLKRNCVDCNPCPHGKHKYKCATCKAARAGQPAPSRKRKRDPEIKPEIKPDPEIKQEPFTIRGYFGFDR